MCFNIEMKNTIQHNLEFIHLLFQNKNSYFF